MTNSWVKLFTGRKEMSQESQEKIAILQVSEKMSKTIFFFFAPQMQEGRGNASTRTTNHEFLTSF